MGRFGKAGWVVLALIVAGVAAAIVAGGGGNDGGKTGIGTGTEARNPPATTTATTAKPAPRKGRQKVRRGHGTTPDRPAPGTGPLLAIADQKPETFGDPLFRRLGIARSRLNTPWN